MCLLVIELLFGLANQCPGWDKGATSPFVTVRPVTLPDQLSDKLPSWDYLM
jgi:hypothetical protein